MWWEELAQPDRGAHDGGADSGLRASLERAGGGVPAVAGRARARGVRLDEAPPRLRAGPRPRGGRGRALVDLDEVELVLRGDGARRVLDVEELGVPRPQPDRLAGPGRRAAVAVADRLHAVIDEEDRGLAVLQHAQVDQHRLVGRGQRLEALERLALQLARCR